MCRQPAEACAYERARAVPAYSRRLGFVDGDPAALLVVEYTGNTASEAQAAAQGLGRRGRILTELAEQADLWAVRKAGLGLLMSVPGDAKPITFMEDVAVPVEQLSRYGRGTSRTSALYRIARVPSEPHRSGAKLNSDLGGYCS